MSKFQIGDKVEFGEVGKPMKRGEVIGIGINGCVVSSDGYMFIVEEAALNRDESTGVAMTEEDKFHEKIFIAYWLCQFKEKIKGINQTLENNKSKLDCTCMRIIELIKDPYICCRTMINDDEFERIDALSKEILEIFKSVLERKFTKYKNDFEKL